VSRITGFSPALLRAWEQRHGFLEPGRSGGGTRLYTRDDVRILLRVRDLMATGRSIGEIAASGRRALLADAPEVDAREATPMPFLGVDMQRLLDTFPDSVVAADREGRIRYANAAVEGLLGWRAADLAGAPLTSLMPQRMHAKHLAGFEKYLSSGTSRLEGRAVRVPALRRDGTEVEVELTLTFPGGTDALVVASLRDLRARVLLEEPGVSPGTSRTMLDTARRLLSGLAIDQVQETAVAFAVSYLQAALARIWTFEADGRTLGLRASAGLSREVAKSSRARIDPDSYPYKIAVVVKTGQAFIKNGIAGDPHFDQEWVTRERIVAASIVPLLERGKLHGVLACFFRSAVSSERIDMLRGLATLVAASLPGASPAA